MNFGFLVYVTSLALAASVALPSPRETEAQSTADGAVRGSMERTKGNARAEARRNNNEYKGQNTVQENRRQKQVIEGAEAITLYMEPNTPARTEVLQVEPDIDGKIILTLHGQKWVDVLQRLTDLSGKTLEWTTLPDDVLNMHIHTRVTLDEARDIVNRMLLDRGYTMLRHGDTVSVHRIQNLNSTILPHIRPEDLERRDQHEFVKVTFDLGEWLQAETVVKDLEFMKGHDGALNPLPSVNCIEAVDLVVNLKQIRNILAEDRAAGGKKRRVRIFRIVHANVLDVDDMLRGILAINAESLDSFTPMTREQLAVQRKMQVQLILLRRRESRLNRGHAALPKDYVRFVANKRDNSILVDATPEKMAIIEQTIEAIDIPASQAQSLPDRLLRTKVYKLATIDPEPLISTLEEIGGLSFNSVLKVDTKSNAIVAYATLADHVTIDALVNKLDGSARKFQVVPLRRLRADHVAGTIDFMMGTGEWDQDDRRSYYSSRAIDEYAAKSDRFRVDADVENNWLLVRADENEMREIDDLLLQLGEKRLSGASTVRYLDTPAGEETDVVLRRIRRIWPRMAPNELRIDPAIVDDEVDESLEQPPALSQVGT